MKKSLVLAAGLLLATALPGLDTGTLDVNRWTMPVTDWGPFGQDATWRRPGQSYLYGCGPWFGAVNGSDTLVSFGYNTNSGASELLPGDSLGDSLVLVYVSPDTWPPPLERFPRAPQVLRADQQAWTCYNDYDSSSHIPPGRPLEIQFWLTGYAFACEPAQDFIFLRWEFENQSADTLRECYFGAAFDPDVGPAGTNHYGGFYQRWVHNGPDSAWVDHVAWVCDDDGNVPGWDSAGAVAAFFVLTPGQQGPSAMKRFTLENDPVTDVAQYLTLAGYNCSTRVYEPFDTADVSPADKRFLLGTGPFDLAPGQGDSAVLAIIGHLPWLDSFGLAEAVGRADSTYQNGTPGIAEERPQSLAGLRAIPQPFGRRVRIAAGPALARETVLELRDVAGRRVRSLGRATGDAWTWDGTDDAGRLVPAGVYCAIAGEYRLKLVRR